MTRRILLVDNHWIPRTYVHSYMAEHPDDPQQSVPTKQNAVILMVRQDGFVDAVVELPDELRPAPDQDPYTIDDLWPGEVSDRIRESLQRTLRERCSTGDEFEDGSGGGQEILYIPQGRNRVMLIARDLSEQKAALSQARKIAYTDKVTGLPSRALLLHDLHQVIDVQRLRQGRAAVLCFCASQFDDHGYTLNSLQQDEVLVQLASRLTGRLRGSNVENPEDYERYSIAARTDFRQFCVVLPSIETGEDAESVVMRLVDDLSKPVQVGARTISVNINAGVALFPQDGNDAAALFENASAAMEDARTDSTTDYKFHSGTVRLRALQRLDLELELRAALDQNLYTLSFLPIVHYKTGSTIAMEALLRWPETIIGTQSARKVVHVAERTGLILPIGEWVMRHACQQLSKWRSAGHSSVRLTINLSAQELISDDIVSRLSRILDEEGIAPADVDLEIKEHILFREALRDFSTCRALRDLGVRIVVDDYGLGTCSLAHLSRSPVSALKIDNSIVADVGTDERSLAACAGAIALARELGLDVMAEGIENQEQARIMAAHGCELMQGFLFGSPMTEADTIRRLDADAAGTNSIEGLS